MNRIQIIFLISIAFFSAANLSIGFFTQKRKSITPAIFIANPNSTNLFLLILSLAGTLIGGGMFFTVSQLGYEAGFAGVFLGISYCIGFLVLGRISHIVRKEFNEKKILTIYQYIDYKFSEPSLPIKVGTLFRLGTGLVYIMFLAAQILIISSFVSQIIPNLAHFSLLIGCSFIFILNAGSYTFFGGLQKDIATDAWQMFLVSIGIISLLVYIGADIEEIRNLPSGYYIGTNKGIVLLIGIILFTGPALLLRPDMWQRIITAKNDKVTKTAMTFSAFISIISFSIFSIVGMYAKSINLESGDIFIYKILDQSSLLSIVIILSLFGAIVSSADTFLNNSSIVFNDIFFKKMNIKTLRWSTVIVVVLSLFLAFVFSDLVDLFASGFGILFIFFPMFICLIIKKNISSLVIFRSTLLGLIIYFIIVWFYPTEAFLPGFLVSSLSMYILNKLNRAKSKQQ